MGLFSFLFGSCSKPKAQELPERPLPEITANTEDGFVDLGFSIRSREAMPDGSQALNVYGLHHGREVGITVIIGSKWKKGSLGTNPPIPTYTGIITYRTLGPASDAFIEVLDQLYATKLQPRTIRPKTDFAGISLEGEPAALTRGPVKIKLFFESEAEDRYAELYTNIDLANNVLQIHEKDPDYRAPIIKALRGE
jgi:hypothetical protein